MARIKKSAPKRRPAAKKKTTARRLSFSGQMFLITVACFVLAILSFTNIQNSQPALDDVGPKKLSIKPPPKKPSPPPPQPQPASKLPPAVPLTAWRGPVQPLPPQLDVAEVITTIPTTEPVVFITIDDGWVQSPEISLWLRSHHLPLTLFLTDNGIKNNYAYFQKLQAAGMTIEDHTLSHPQLPRLNLDQQKAEICGAADTYQRVFGNRPTLFRPPYGAHNVLTSQAAQACGMRAIIMWRAVAENGVIHYQDNNTDLKPGDIVLTHFQPDLIANLQALSAELSKQHLQIGHLEDWLQ